MVAPAAKQTRRTPRVVFIILGIVAIICCGAPATIGAWILTGGIDTVGKVDFVNQLAIPPLAPSTVNGDGEKVFDLRATTGRHTFAKDRTADTLGYNGDYLGPTLRAAVGDKVRINVHNEIGTTTTVHWHGMHLPAMMDGGPHQPIAANTTWSPYWTIHQPATTLWYHPHPHGETAKQVYRGLAGMFILDDPQASALALPKEYGVDDIPVIVQDKAFGGSGGLKESNSFLSGLGLLGNEIVVNGTYAPFLTATTEQVRLRLLNGSNARTYNFGFADDRQFAIVGTDGGLLPAPYRTNRVMMSPGERVEIVLAVAPRERVVLRSYPPALEGGMLNDRFSGGKDQFDVLEVRGADSLKPSPAVPASLVPVERLDPAQATTTRTFDIGDNMINEKKMDMNRVDATVHGGTTEVWNVRNLDGAPHNFHIHGVDFQVLSIAGAEPPPELRGWKDTVFTRSGKVIRLLVRFGDETDPQHPFMLHCHVLFHEDQGMMAQFVVVAPGQQANLAPTGHHP